MNILTTFTGATSGPDAMDTLNSIIAGGPAMQRALAAVGAPATQYATLQSFAHNTGGMVGSGIDQSGNGGDVQVSAALTLATAWGNPGYLTTGAGTGMGASIDLSTTTCDFDTQSFAVGGKINMAAPGASINIMGHGQVATFQGAYLTVTAAGKLSMGMRTSGGNVTGSGGSLQTIADGTDHTFFCVWDGPSKSMIMFIDGVLDTVKPAVVNWLGGSLPSSDWNIGIGGAVLATATTSVIKLASLHILRFAGNPPINLGGIARRLNANNVDALRSYEIIPTQKKVLLGLIGCQSNELGSGENMSGTGDFGAPRRGDNGNAGSMWPYLQTLAGKRGTWLETSNTAVGSTSLPSSWVGFVQNWTSGMIVVTGSIVLSNGSVWKCATAPANTTATSTTAPAGTANVTGADGVPWTYLGAPTASDVAGRVQRFGDANFDPNGYIATAVAGMNRTGFDAKYMLSSIGQGDKTLSTSRATMLAAYKSMTDYVISLGFKMILGFTCYAPTAEAWYQSDLLPAYADALAFYASNPNEVAGANLRTELGVLATTPTRGPGLKADNIHMNNAAYKLASEAQYRAMVAGGVI